ncbi:MAG TPA: metalloregulator ArsR/SmtB family transcription factor [Planctomycetota bacterium]
MNGPGLHATAARLKLLAEPSRVRLLHLLEQEELTVAELVRTTGLTQSRVSTHLARLKEAGLVRERRVGSATYHALQGAAMPEDARGLWQLLRIQSLDGTVREDRARLRAVLQTRDGRWADRVAGRMERHYSPGRTWESAARGLLGLARLGDVLDVASGDGALAELVAPRARSVTCLDRSRRVIAGGVSRLENLPNLRFVAGDMHALPFPDASFDHVLFMNALSYSETPRLAVREVARVLRPGGSVAAVMLDKHEHADVAATYDHVQSGFRAAALRRMFRAAGLVVEFAGITSRERRPPYFQVLTLHAHRSADA